MSDEGTIPVAVGQNVSVEAANSGSNLFGIVVGVILFALFCWAIYYFFFRKATVLVAAAGGVAWPETLVECPGGVCPVMPRMRVRGGGRA
jgi:hypothetical protein